MFLLQAKKQMKTMDAALQAAELQVCHTLGTWRQALTQPDPKVFAVQKKKLLSTIRFVGLQAAEQGRKHGLLEKVGTACAPTACSVVLSCNKNSVQHTHVYVSAQALQDVKRDLDGARYKVTQKVPGNLYSACTNREFS